jgi:nitrile hydratase
MPILRADQVVGMLRRGGSARRPADGEARFRVGDRVQVRNVHPYGHTRMPRYVRGRCGLVSRDHGTFVLPDSNAAGRGECPQHVYSVCFTGRELWGPDAPRGDRVYVDLWDDYLVGMPGGR